jgi:hypothetical protein
LSKNHNDNSFMYRRTWQISVVQLLVIYFWYFECKSS